MLLSLRRRGQLLLATCVLAGVVLGAGCGMMVEGAQAPSPFTVPAWERGASAAAGSTSDRAPSGSRTAASGSQADEVVRPTSSPDRADRHHKAGKHGKHHRGKTNRGKEK
jgi:hypothetical protein